MPENRWVERTVCPATATEPASAVWCIRAGADYVLALYGFAAGSSKTLPAEGSHEFMYWRVSPATPLAPGLALGEQRGLHLETLGRGFLFWAGSDEEALDRVQACVDAVVAGRRSIGADLDTLTADVTVGELLAMVEGNSAPAQRRAS